MKKYYLYCHIRQDNGSIFYIGIGGRTKQDIIYGTYTRAYSRRNRNPHWHNIAKKVGYRVEILLHSDNQDLMIDKEIEFIKFYGRIDKSKGSLVNLTDGGEGIQSYQFTEEQRIRLSQSHIGKKLSPESIRKAADSKRGKSSGMLGKHHNKLSREKISKSNKGKVRTYEMRAKYSSAKKGIAKTETHKENLRKSVKSRPIEQYTLQGNFVKVYPSLSSVRKDNFTMQNVHKCCNGIVKTCEGFIWKYKQQ